MRNEEIRRFSLLTGLVTIALVLPCIGVGQVQVGKKNNRKTVDLVASSPDLTFTSDNSENPPLLIREASAKEVNGSRYQKLTQNAPGAESYVSYPKIRLYNNTDKTIVSFGLVLRDKRSKKMVGLILKSRLEPFSELSFESSQWVRRDTTVTGSKEKGFRTDTSVPSWDSQDIWLPGPAENFYVLVGRVYYSDGTVWKTSR